MTMMELIITISAVAGAVIYLGVVARRKLRSKSCGCKSSVAESRTQLTVGGRSV